MVALILAMKFVTLAAKEWLSNALTSIFFFHAHVENLLYITPMSNILEVNGEVQHM